MVHSGALTAWEGGGAAVGSPAPAGGGVAARELLRYPHAIIALP